MKRIVCVLALFVVLPTAVRAQSGRTPFEVAGQLTTVRLSEFDATDVGIGGRLGWRVTDLLGLEAELSVFPSEFPNTNGFSRGRVEGLFGATVGPSLGRVRPFASVKPGFARFRGASEPVACIAIFPPPLSCALSAGSTVFAMELGGGVDIAATPRSFIRVNAGDRLLRYPGPAFVQGTRHDGDTFVAHEFRVSVGAGLRF